MNDACRDFLVEFGTEELPPLALPELETRICRTASAAGSPKLACRTASCVRSPRRGGSRCWCATSPSMQPAQAIKLKGPPVSAAFDKDGKPTAAAHEVRGEMRRRTSARSRASPKARANSCSSRAASPAKRPSGLLPGIVQRSLDAAAHPETHALGRIDRGVRAAGALAGAAVRRGGDSGAHPRHRCGHARRAGIASWRRRNSRSRSRRDYEAVLREKGKVIADFGERRARIGEQVAALRQVARPARHCSSDCAAR